MIVLQQPDGDWSVIDAAGRIVASGLSHAETLQIVDQHSKRDRDRRRVMKRVA